MANNISQPIVSHMGAFWRPLKKIKKVTSADGNTVAIPMGQWIERNSELLISLESL